MAYFRINVLVDPARANRGIDAVDRGLARLDQRSNRLRDTLTRTLQFAGVGFLVRELADLGEEYNSVQNKIRFVTKSQAELAEVTERLLKLSNETRVSFASASMLFTRVATNGRELGLSFEETLGFTRSLNQAILLSGATAKETNGSLIQLSQGLAAGALRGDELRSVLEQLPFVADVIAKKLGVTRGALRFLAAQGKLTSRLIVDAFKDYSKALDESFSRTIPTLKQSFEVLRNELVVFVGRTDNANSITARLSQLILLLAKNLELVSRVILTVVVGRAIAALIAGLRQVALLARSNPLVLLVQGATAAAAALVVFSDKIKVSSDGITTLQDVVVSAFNVIVEFIKSADLTVAGFTAAISGAGIALVALAPAISRVVGLVKGLTLALARNPLILIATTALAAGFAVKRLADELDKVERRTAKAGQIDSATKNLEEVGRTLQRRQQELQRLLATLDARTKSPFDGDRAAAETLRREIVRVQGEIDKLTERRTQGIEEIRKLSGELDVLKLQDLDPEAEGKKLGDGLAAGIKASGLSGLFEQVLSDAQKRAADRKAAASQSNPVADLTQGSTPADPAALTQALIQLDSRNELIRQYLGLTTSQLKVEEDLLNLGVSLNKQQADSFRAAAASNQQLELRKQLLSEIRGPQEALLDAERQLDGLLDQGLITQEQYNVKLRDLAIAAERASGTVGGALVAAVLDLQQELSAAQIATDVFSSAFNTASDALAEFVINGKADIKDFARSFLADITRIITRLLVLQAIEAATAAFGGGAANAAINIAARAGGGPVEKGQPYIVGEEGPELLVPDFSGEILPADKTAAVMAGSGGGGGTATMAQPEVGVTVVNQLDPRLALNAMDTPQGQQVILNAISARRGQVKRLLA